MSIILLGRKNARRIFRGGARETHVTRVITKRLLAESRSFSDLPAFLGPNGTKLYPFLKLILKFKILVFEFQI